VTEPSPASTPSERDGDVLACDVLVVGGGINGAGIARDLAGRGWRVVLCEKEDLASHTSSASTKLIHGGLRYLEYYEFGLVRKALIEREVLLASAPHIMRPLRFVMPHDAAMRPAWLIRLGLFLYDHLARREWLPGSTGLDLRRHLAGQPLQERFTRGFEYSDGWVDDARLVALCALDAAERGATILTRTRCATAHRTLDGWQAELERRDGTRLRVRARALVNAAGPWAESFLRERAQPVAGETLATKHLRLVKGSHIVVPKCFEGEHAYIFQNADGRIIFAIPYEERFTLIGTTDVELKSNPGSAAIEMPEVVYLCDQASRYFKRPVRPDDVVWTFAGVRPLLDDASGNPAAVTRDYVLEQHAEGGGPLLTVWGGKITTFRKLAEQAADDVGRMLGDSRPAWTLHATLPGGDLAAALAASGARAERHPERHPARLRAAYLADVLRRHPWLPEPLARRYVSAYGTRVERLLAGATDITDLGTQVASWLFEAELRYLQEVEWVTGAEDVLWRRSKLGLHLQPAERDQVAAWFAQENRRR
jgi:glycerol-3-phosphate dehydrogenase